MNRKKSCDQLYVEIEISDEEEDELCLDVNNLALLADDEAQLKLETKYNRKVISEFIQMQI